jgi:hypothetical protein
MLRFLRQRPSFLSRRTFSGSRELVLRQTGDVFSIIPNGSRFLCAVNHCYQTSRDTYREALDWVEQEARIYLLTP